jgi:plastocyanin
VRRSIAVASAALACFVFAFLPASTAGAAGDPVVTMPADCGGPAFCFTPSTLTITDGQTVTWSNQSGTEHIVTRCAPSDCDGVGGGTGTDAGFTSGDVPSGSTYAHTFHGPGTYTYYCAIHGYAAMHGAIVVNAATPPTTAAPSTVPPSTGAPSSTAPSAVTTASAAAAMPGPNPGPPPSAQLAHTGTATGSALALGLGALVLGLAAWGVCTRKRGVVSRLWR